MRYDSVMQSKAKTVDAYLKELPADRRAALEIVRKVILKNLDKDYQEGMGYGMMGYSVPHSIYPDGYHCDPKQPLPFAGMASQKNHMSIYMMCHYNNTGEEGWFRSEWDKAVKAGRAKKLDMGKCCIRFKKVEDLALDVIGEAIRRVPVKAYIEFYERSLLANNVAAAKRKAAKMKAAATPAAANKKPAAATTKMKKKVAKRAAK